ncbi:MAG: hypothetical protein ACI4J1_07570 [Ruminiclostridium sp.]
MDKLIDNRITYADRLTRHLLDSARNTGGYAKRFDNERYGYLCGVIHDVGKFAEEYRICRRNGGDYPLYSEAAAVCNKLGPGGRLIAYCVAGLENGLINYGCDSSQSEDTLCGILDKSEGNASFPDEIEERIKLPIIPVVIPFMDGGFSYSFFVRMIFSCLLESEICGKYIPCNAPDYSAWLGKIQRVAESSPYGEQIMAAVKAGSCDQSIMSVSMPKNQRIIPLAFAASHGERNGLDRIIYVVSEQSMPEIAAREIGEITGSADFFTAHCNASKGSFSHSFSGQAIVTTHEHFFNSCFSAEKNYCRKLHNLAGSIIVFEDLWQYDRGKLLPYVSVIIEIVRNCNSSVLLANSAQSGWMRVFPAVEPVDRKKLPKPAEKKYTLAFEDYFTAMESAKADVLVLYNDLDKALECFDAAENTYFLSEYMCPAHREKVFEQIKTPSESKRIVFARKAVGEFSCVICLDNDLDLFFEAENGCADGGRINVCGGNESEYTAEEIKLAIDKRYSDRESLDKNKIGSYFKGCGLSSEKPDESFRFQFKTVSGLAAESTVPLIIPFEKEIDIKNAVSDSELQKYIINIPVSAYERLLREESVMPINGRGGVLMDKSLYRSETGFICNTDF